MEMEGKLRDLLELEALLFGGIPEATTPVFERDVNSNAQDHPSYAAPFAFRRKLGLSGRVICRPTINWETGEISVSGPK